MKKILLAAVLFAVVLILATQAISISGYFSKAFTQKLYPEDSIEQNITIRKYFNLTIKFQKYNSTSSLTIRNSNTTIILKDASLNEIQRIVGMDGYYAYLIIDKLDLDKVKFLSAYNLNNSASTYEDIIDQPVNVSYTGTKATIIGKTNLVTTGDATISGYVKDELTGSELDGIQVLAFEFNSDPNLTNPKSQSTTTSGRYTLTIATNSLGKPFDIYIKDYDVSPA